LPVAGAGGGAHPQRIGLGGLAVLAYPLGIALDPEWGRGQTLLLAVGLVLVCIGVGLLFQRQVADASRWLAQETQKLPGRCGSRQ